MGESKLFDQIHSINAQIIELNNQLEQIAAQAGHEHPLAEDTRRKLKAAYAEMDRVYKLIKQLDNGGLL